MNSIHRHFILHRSCILHIAFLLLLSLAPGASVFSQTTEEENEEETEESIEETDTAYAEEDTSTYSFEYYVSLFKQAGITSLEPIYNNTEKVTNRIPDNVAYQFIETSTEFNAEVFYYTIEVLSENPYYILCYQKYVAAGPGLEQIFVQTYSLGGELLDNVMLGESYPSSGPDGDGVEVAYQFFQQYPAVEVVKNITTYDVEKETTDVHTEWIYYGFDSTGQISEMPGREYPEASDRVIPEDELMQYTADELLIMRNEIFAAHGYIFKTEAMKKYFEKKIWYSPAYEKVDDQLTEIEEENLKTIQLVEKKLKSK